MRALGLRWAASLLAVAATALGVLGCGSHTGNASHASSAGKHRGRRSRQTELRVTVAAVGQLPAAVSDPAAVSFDGSRLVLLGGLDSTDNSTDSITVWSADGATSGGTLPVPQHDAQAAQLGQDVYVFGGGEFSSFDHILSYDPSSEAVAQAGTLPTAASDVAVAALGGTAYVVGGYDGVNWLDTILAWRPALAPQVAGRLPFGLRYAAVAAAGRRLIIAGGTLPTGVSDAILSFDPASGKVTQIGRLPTALTHSSAAWADDRVLLIGGRQQVSGDQTSAILAINPRSGGVREVGRLPYPLSDAGVVRIGGRVIVAGGENAAGAQNSILAVTPHLVAEGAAK
jgi:N-acetylneuraminic acid mutarotase